MSSGWSIGSDIDGTLTGDPQALQRLSERIARFRAAGGFFALVTGRSYGQTLCGLVDEGLPYPDAIITQVGTEIYLPPFAPDQRPLSAWAEHLAQTFCYADALALVQSDPQWVLQPGRANTALKASWWFQGSGDRQEAVQGIAQRVAQTAGYRLIWSSGRDLDILPAAAGKGEALRFLLQHCGRDPQRCAVAGDTGNDIDMLQAFDHAIVVANAQAELQSFARSRSQGVYLATRPFAAGVEEGLDHWAVFADSESSI